MPSNLGLTGVGFSLVIQTLPKRPVAFLTFIKAFGITSSYQPMIMLSAPMKRPAFKLETAMAFPHRLGRVVLAASNTNMSGQEAEAYGREMGYFEKNKERMRYDNFRRQGVFVGSGVVEAGCKTVIGQRLKQSGMHWTVNGANSIIALRCCFFSNRWEDFWEYRSSA